MLELLGLDLGVLESLRLALRVQELAMLDVACHSGAVTSGAVFFLSRCLLHAKGPKPQQGRDLLTMSTE